MAHVAKFTAGSAGHIIGHCEREMSAHGDYLKYKTKSDIDPSRTELNKTIDLNDGLTAHERLKKRLSEVRVLKRKDVNVMADWVITYPRELSQDDLMWDFFDSAAEFLMDRYGAENLVCANVHMDESQPHLHYCFVPVTYDARRNDYKVSAKEVLNKSDLMTFHDDLESYLSRTIDFPKGLLHSGITKAQGGNKTVDELKNDINHLSRQVQLQQSHLNDLVKINKVMEEVQDFCIPEAKKTPVGAIFTKEQYKLLTDGINALKSNLGIYMHKYESVVSKVKQLTLTTGSLKDSVDALKIDLKQVRDENWIIACERGDFKAENSSLKRKIEKLQEFVEPEIFYAVMNDIPLRTNNNEYLDILHKDDEDLDEDFNSYDDDKAWDFDR